MSTDIPSHGKKAAFERIVAIVQAAKPAERPAIPVRASAPKDKIAGRRKPAGPIDASPETPAEAELAAAPSIDIPGNANPSRVDPRNPDREAADLDETLAICSQLDQSDTDNGTRLIAYFGKDLTVRAEAEVAAGSFLTWTGTHWDIDDGAAAASKKAQLVGPLIMREAEFLQYSPAEERAVAAARAARAEYKSAEKLEAARTAELEDIIEAGKRAQGALSKRRAARRGFGISCKNSSRLANMIREAGPHLRRAVEDFNADPLLVATKTHTLRFVKERDPECPDPAVERYRSKLIATEGHDRANLLTSAMPVDYRPAAKAPRWTAFLERFMPDAATRRTLQQFTGLGLTGLPAQRFMLHHGTGANGKSVYLEVITCVLGPSMAAGMPTEAIVGGAQKSGSQAQPEVARLFGKRMVRVLELPQGQPLQVDVVKKLTGGEMIPVRTLFKGFFEFRPTAKPHFSTNGQPYIDDSSNAIWRRMFAVQWPVELALAEQRDFDEVVREFLQEAPGILNWLIEGLLDYLANGFVVSEGIMAGVQQYRDDMDPTGPFCRECVLPVAGEFVQAANMYEAYVCWSVAAARKHVTQTKFGLLMKHKVKRDDTGRLHRYVDCRLHDVPLLTEEQRIKAGLAPRPRRTDGDDHAAPSAEVVEAFAKEYSV